MEPLIALGQILLGAIPTLLLVWILYFFSKQVFFKPLQETMRKRWEATGGLRQAAESHLALAEKKTAEYQQALQEAWTELYRQQEQERQRALEQRAAMIQQARQQAEEMGARAQQEIQQEVEEARDRLAQESVQMARAIREAVIRPATVSAPSGSPGGSGVRP